MQCSASLQYTIITMSFIKTEFPGLLIYEPRVYEDDRGFFFESYNENVFAKEGGIRDHFVQDNQACSAYGVVRGLHYQLNPHAQSKLVRALEGTILDVVLDLRKGSPKYGEVFSIELSGENKRQLYIPKGFAHGYSVLTDTAEVIYKCDAFYNKESEGGILPYDPALNIDWKVPAHKAVLSGKDQRYPGFADCMHNFVFEG
jgi:dTDP-4-dehydrorhamnose 3,5-epimerase